MPFFSRARKLLGKKPVADKPEQGRGEGEERGQRSGDDGSNGMVRR